jgi:hypothetical protein
LLVLLVAAVVGTCVGGGIYLLGSSDSDDGWAELGALLMGVAGGVVAFVVAYICGLVLAARRAFGRGGRMLPVSLSFALPAELAAVLAVGAAVSQALGTDLPRAAAVVAVLGSLVAAPTAFAWAGTSTGRRRLVIAMAALTVLVVVVTAVGVALGRVELRQTADRLPLVVFRGGTAAAPFDGWRRDELSSIRITDDASPFAKTGQQAAALKYFTREGFAFLTMHTGVAPCQDTALYTCRTSGTLRGAEVRRYDRIAEFGSYPSSAAFDMLVYPDGTGVSVNTETRVALPGTTPVRLLESLVRVDRDTFEQATGAALRLN